MYSRNFGRTVKIRTIIFHNCFYYNLEVKYPIKCYGLQLNKNCIEEFKEHSEATFSFWISNTFIPSLFHPHKKANKYLLML